MGEGRDDDGSRRRGHDYRPATDDKGGKNRPLFLGLQGHVEQGQQGRGGPQVLGEDLLAAGPLHGAGKIAHFELGYIPESAKELKAAAGFLITNHSRKHIMTLRQLSNIGVGGWT